MNEILMLFYFIYQRLQKEHIPVYFVDVFTMVIVKTSKRANDFFQSIFLILIVYLLLADKNLTL